MRKKLLNNLLYVFVAQGAVLLLSLVLNLIVPKVIGKIEFGYWQFFLLLTNYVGFFTFGFSDGYYLKEGGKTTEELDFEKIGGELKVFILTQFLVSIFIFTSSFFLDDKKLLVQIIAIYLFFQNLSNFFGFVFQAQGAFKKYSFSVIIDKIFFLICFGSMMFFRTTTYIPFIIFYTCGKAVSVFYCVLNGREFLRYRKFDIKNSLKDTLSTTSIGANIMISNILNSLIIGGGRFVIEQKWGIKAFGEVSLSFSFTFFFLMFVTQIGTVLFPLIKKLDSTNIDRFFISIKSKLDILLPMILILYYPLELFLSIWLPQYSSSIRYLIILLPLCLYEGKFHMLYLVFYKALRYERKLLLVNVSSFVLSIFLCIMCAYLFKSLNLVLVSLIFTIALRSLFSEHIFSKKISNLEEFVELALVLVFIISNWFLDKNIASAIFGIAFIGYFMFNRMKLRTALIEFKILKL